MGVNVPSARKTEWKGNSVKKARKNFLRGFDKIDFRNCRTCEHRCKDDAGEPVCPYHFGLSKDAFKVCVERGWQVEGCRLKGNQQGA
jgi:hypothetical protein